MTCEVLSAAEAFPSRDLVLAACRGFPVDRCHPVLDAAGELAVLHQQREQTPCSELRDIDWQRTRLVLEIDRWAAQAAPRPSENSRVHTETVGQVIDRLSQLTMQTFVTLSSAPDAVYHDACAVLDDLADAYQDLVDDIAAGARRLPRRFTHP